MAKLSPIAFARAPAAILFQSENDNMWGDWEDYIVATRNKRGVYAVITRKYSDEYLDGKTRKKWFTIHAIRNVRTPEEFIQAVRQCETALNVDVYWDDVLEGVSSLDAAFSLRVAESASLV